MFKLLAVSEIDSQHIKVRTNWQAHSYIAKHERRAFGSAEYLVDRSAESWQIVRKKTLLLNDVPDTVMDFYSM